MGNCNTTVSYYSSVVQSGWVCRGCGSCSNSHSGSRALSILGNHRFLHIVFAWWDEKLRGKTGYCCSGCFMALPGSAVYSIPSLLISQMVPLRRKGCGKFHMWTAEARGTDSSVGHNMFPLFLASFPKTDSQILLGFGDVASHII